MNSKIAIYIPAYNAASTVCTVLDRIPSKLKDEVEEIFVVDNNSTDFTNLVVIKYKEENNLHNLEVIRNQENMGYGGSQQIAYQRAIEKGYSAIAMLHGDAQYAPELLETLIAPIVNGEADMVFGSRMSGDPRKGGMPLHRYLGNRVLTTVQNILLGTHLSEFHSGYRVYSVEALRKLPLTKFSRDYHFDTETIIAMKHLGLRIAERPIPTHYGDEKNYVNIWKYGMDVLRSTVSYFLHKTGIRKSRNWSRIFS